MIEELETKDFKPKTKRGEKKHVRKESRCKQADHGCEAEES